MTDTATAPKGQLVISHTTAEGTLLEGSSRGDGSAEVVKIHRWKWGRSIGCWFVPFSRDRAPKLYLIDATAKALRAAGFEVEVTVDAAPRAMEEAEADRAARAEDRVDRYEGHAANAAASSKAAHDRVHQIADSIPFGQPILVGHHSERRARKDQERIEQGMRKAIDENSKAEHYAERAESSANHMDRRENPVTVANRIKKLEADIRGFERSMTPCRTSGLRLKPHVEGPEVMCPVCYCDQTIGPERVMPVHGAATGDYLAQVQANLEHAREQLRYWQQVREQQIAEGTATNYGPDSIKPGDAIKTGQWWSQWRKVKRVNKTTVSVETDYTWTDRVPYHEIKDHKTAEELKAAAEQVKAAEVGE